LELFAFYTSTPNATAVLAVVTAISASSCAVGSCEIAQSANNRTYRIKKTRKKKKCLRVCEANFVGIKKEISELINKETKPQ
jgi:hypothetical protein